MEAKGNEVGMNYGLNARKRLDATGGGGRGGLGDEGPRPDDEGAFVAPFVQEEGALT